MLDTCMMDVGRTNELTNHATQAQLVGKLSKDCLGMFTYDVVCEVMRWTIFFLF